MKKVFNEVIICLLLFCLFPACNLQNVLFPQSDAAAPPRAVEDLQVASLPQYKITYYWVFDPDEEPVDLTTQFMELRDVHEQVIAAVPRTVAERIATEGSGFLPSDPLYVEPDSKAGVFLNVANDQGWPGIRFMEINKKVCPWGLSAMGEALVPYWTVAVDPDVLPLGTLIYIPAYDGYVLPAGFTTKKGSPVHDGIFYCGDVSWSFRGKQIDIFTASYTNWRYTEKWLSSHSRVPAGIHATPAPFPQPHLKHAVPGDRIEAEDYDQGGEGTGYHDTTRGNYGSVYRTDDVDLEYCSDTGGGYNVGWVKAGEWLKYTVTAAAHCRVRLDIRVACWGPAQTLHAEMDDVDVTGLLTVPYTGYWQNWITLTTEQIMVAAGTHTFKLVWHGSGFNVNWIQFSTSNPTPTPSILPTPTPTMEPGKVPGAASITPFLDNRRAAYSPTYDDGLWVSLAAIFNLHKQYNIRGTVCINSSDWINNYADKRQDLVHWLASGYYRLGSHTHTHVYLPALTGAEVRYECQYSNQLLYTYTGYKPESLSWPYDGWDQRTAEILAAYYVCARGADTYDMDSSLYAGGEPPDNPRFMALHAYVYGNKYKAAQMNNWIDTAITGGKWLTVNFHGIDREGWGPADTDKLRAHYAYVHTRAPDIWVEGMAEVGKYLKERKHAEISLVTLTSLEIVIDVAHNLPPLIGYDAGNNNLLYTIEYDYPLTVKLFVHADWHTALVTQGVQTFPVVVKAEGVSRYILVNIIPNGGLINVRKID